MSRIPPQLVELRKKEKSKVKPKGDPLAPTAKDLKTYRDLAVPWTEDIKYTRGKRLVVEHTSFNNWVQTYMATLEGEISQVVPRKPFKFADKHAFMMLPLRFNKYFVRELPWASIPTDKATKNCLPMVGHGLVTWDGDVVIPVLQEDGDPWMSLTPNEVVTQRQGIRWARGKTLVGGLGMGWAARRILERKQVSHVTIVERDANIIKYFGTPLERDFGDKVKIINDDFYTYLNIKRGEYVNYVKTPPQIASKVRLNSFDSIICDIWSTHSCRDFDDRWKLIKQLHPHAWGWGNVYRD